MTTQAPPAQQIAAQATSSSTGAATFTFPMAPQGYVVSGTVSIPMANILANIQAVKSGLIVGVWNGNNPWGPVEANPGETLQLNVTGLAASTQYTAVWLAQVVDVANAPGASPLALQQSELVAVQSFTTNMGVFSTASAANFTVDNIPTNTRTLLAYCSGGSDTIYCQGNTSGTFYFGTYGVNVTTNNLGPAVIPFFGAIDQTANFTDLFGPNDWTIFALSEEVLVNPSPTSVVSGGHQLTSGSPTVAFIDAGALTLSGPYALKEFVVQGTGATGNVELVDTATGTVLALVVTDGISGAGPVSIDLHDTLLPMAAGVRKVSATWFAGPTGGDIDVTLVWLPLSGV